MKFNNNEEAVSPVIGVILMVAITVILAAVIAVFVFGMADDIQTTHTVAATAKVSDGNVLITFQGGPDANVVTNLSASLYNNSKTAAIKTSPIEKEVGSTIAVPLTQGSDIGDRIVVTASFDDGSTQVILDKLL